MGVKCIRTERTAVEEEPVFLYQNMIMVKKNSDPKLEYDFLEKIGRGSFSQVYKARHKHTRTSTSTQKTCEQSSKSNGRTTTN
jgi:serine/threonine protein kinase